MGAAAGLAWAIPRYSSCREDEDAWQGLCDVAFVVPVVGAAVVGVLGWLTGDERWIGASPRSVGVIASPTGEGFRVAFSMTS